MLLTVRLAIVSFVRQWKIPIVFADNDWGRFHCCTRNTYCRSEPVVGACFPWLLYDGLQWHLHITFV